MKKNVIIIIGVVVVVVAIAVILQGRRGDEPAVAESGKELVVRILAPQPAPSRPVKVSPLKFETVEVYEEIEVAEPEAAAPGVPEPEAEPEAKKVAAARVSPGQVLAVINGRPLTGAELMPPSRFKKDGTAVLPVEILKEVLERSIERELLFQEAWAREVSLGERQQARLEAMYAHLTGNPLNLPEGQEVAERNVLGGDGDAAFHVREQASRLLQVGFLEQAGQSDTAEARLAFRAQLKSGATIEVVETAPPEEVGE